jgi:hypothetical protein
MSVAHVNHPKMIEHGLVDGCPRCLEISQDPFFNLDDGNLIALVDRTRRWMKDETFPRSDSERDAMRHVEQFLVRVRHLRNCGVDL